MDERNNLICDFLKKNVIGRTLKTDEIVYRLEEGKLEGIYTDEMFFSDSLFSQNGIRFNMTTVTREKIYILDGNEKRGNIKKDFSGVSVFQYELAERKSTSRLTGIMKLISSTVREHTMDLRDNPVGCLSSHAKYSVFCYFSAEVVRNLKVIEQL